jgi:hypothetical protein
MYHFLLDTDIVKPIKFLVIELKFLRKIKRNEMAKRIIQKKIVYYKTLLTETKGFLKRLQIKFWIYNEQCKLKKYK